MGKEQKLKELREKLAELNKRHERACGSHKITDSVRLMEQIEELEEEIAALEKE